MYIELMKYVHRVSEVSVYVREVCTFIQLVKYVCSYS